MAQSNISKEELPQFKRKYNRAVSSGKETFTWKGQEILTGYAKYVIEYLETL